MKNYLTEIQNKLRSFVLLEKRKSGLEKFYQFLISLCVLFFFLFTLEAIGHFTSPVRTIIFFAAVLGSLLIGIIYILIPFIKDHRYCARPDYVSTAKIVGDNFPEIKDDLANALQLIDEKKSGYSESLIDAAFKSVYLKSEHLDFNSIIKFDKTRKLFQISLASIVGFFILLFVIPGFSSAAFRLFHFQNNFSAPPKFIFQISPGNKELTKGESVSIKIRVIGQQPEEILFHSRLEEQSGYVDKKLLPDSLGYFTYEVVSIKSSMEYFVEAEKVASELFKITVINRPVISLLELTVLPPAYSKLPIINQRDNGNVSVLAGSKIKIKVVASRELSRSIVEFSDSVSKEMRVNGNEALLEFSAVKEAGYKIIISDKQNFSNANPIEYSLKLLKDNSPSIELVSPKEDLKLGNQNKISLI